MVPVAVLSLKMIRLQPLGIANLHTPTLGGSGVINF